MANLPANIAGDYAFRFSGFSVDENGVSFYIVGVGQFSLKSDGTLGGAQKSSITQLATQGASLSHNAYALSGKWNFDNDGTGNATITFDGSAQTMTGTFDLVAAGTDRFWMISSGAQVAPHGGQPGYVADEVVSGEAVRIS